MEGTEKCGKRARRGGKAQDGYSKSRLAWADVSQGYAVSLCDGRHPDGSFRLRRVGSILLIQMGKVVTPGVGSG